MGLDISTTTIGWNIIKNNKSSDIVETGFIKPIIENNNDKIDELTNSEKLFYKCIYSIEKINKILNEHKDIKYIFIEDSLKGFASGKTRADIKIMLITINSFIHYELWKTNKYIIKKIHPSSARKLVIGKATNKSFKKPSTKRFAMLYLIKKYGKTFYYNLPRMKTKDKLDDSAFDISDSLIISLAGQKNI